MLFAEVPVSPSVVCGRDCSRRSVKRYYTQYSIASLLLFLVVPRTYRIYAPLVARVNSASGLQGCSSSSRLVRPVEKFLVRYIASFRVMLKLMLCAMACSGAALSSSRVEQLNELNEEISQRVELDSPFGSGECSRCGRDGAND